VVIYREQFEDSKYYLWYELERDKVPKTAIILYEAMDIQELREKFLQYHHSTQNDPNRLKERPQKKPRAKHTKEALLKIGNAARGRKYPPEVLHRRSESLKHAYSTGKRKKPTGHLGEQLTWTHRARMREAAASRKRIVCEFCGEECAVNMYHRWHGENCRNW
jgi:hypothetical protein